LSICIGETAVTPLVDATSFCSVASRGSVVRGSLEPEEDEELEPEFDEDDEPEPEPDDELELDFEPDDELEPLDDEAG
jgi:hypothetical protein